MNRDLGKIIFPQKRVNKWRRTFNNSLKHKNEINALHIGSLTSFSVSSSYNWSTIFSQHLYSTNCSWKMSCSFYINRYIFLQLYWCERNAQMSTKKIEDSVFYLFFGHRKTRHCLQTYYTSNSRVRINMGYFGLNLVSKIWIKTSYLNQWVKKMSLNSAYRCHVTGS